MWSFPAFQSNVPAMKRVRETGWIVSIRSCCLLCLLLPLAGCNRDSYFRLFGYDRASLLKKWTPQDDQSLAVHYTDLLRQSQFGQIEEHLDPSIRNAETRNTLTRMYQMIPSGEPASIKTVEASVLYSSDGSSLTNLTLEYEFAPRLSSTNSTEFLPGSWILSQVSIYTSGGVKTITGFYVMPASKSFEEANEFTLTGKGSPQYGGLFLAIAASALTLYAFVLCIRMKVGKKRLIWFVPIAIGVFRLTVNWTSGQWSFTPLAVQGPPVYTTFTPYGPCMILTTVPVGAIAFLLWRKRIVSSLVGSSTQSESSGSVIGEGMQT